MASFAAPVISSSSLESAEEATTEMTSEGEQLGDASRDSSRFTFTSAKGASVINGVGDCLFEGFLEKKGGGTRSFGRRNWTKRWFVLHRNVLAYYKASTDKKPAGQVELAGCRLETESPTKHDRHLTIHTAQGRAFAVRCADAAQYAEFKEAMGKATTTDAQQQQENSAISRDVAAV